MTTPPHEATTPTASTAHQVRAGWDRVARDFDAHVTPTNIQLGEQVLRRFGVTDGTRVLDVAAGSGALAIPAAHLGAHVVATDLSPVMIEHLTARADDERLAIDARVMDGSALDFDDDTFDLSVSQHGASLFADMARGLDEMVRVTRPGGQVLVIAFGPLPQAEFITFCVGAVRATVPSFSGLPVDPPPLPFQVADPDRFHTRLTDAGLRDVTVEPTTRDMPFRSAEHLWTFFASSNPIAAGVAAGLTDEQIAEVHRVLDRMLRERSEGAPEAVLRVALNIGVGSV